MKKYFFMAIVFLMFFHSAYSDNISFHQTVYVYAAGNQANVSYNMTFRRLTFVEQNGGDYDLYLIDANGDTILSTTFNRSFEFTIPYNSLLYSSVEIFKGYYMIASKNLSVCNDNGMCDGQENHDICPNDCPLVNQNINYSSIFEESQNNEKNPFIFAVVIMIGAIAILLLAKKKNKLTVNTPQEDSLHNEFNNSMQYDAANQYIQSENRYTNQYQNQNQILYDNYFNQEKK